MSVTSGNGRTHDMEEDEVWKFWVHTGLLVQTNSSCLQGSAHSFGCALKLQHIPSGAGGLQLPGNSPTETCENEPGNSQR